MACSAREREVSPPVQQAPSTAENQPRSLETDFDFVEQPSQDFFCPVSLELLLEPQLTSCCGHHMSLEAATRLQREGKPCPMCNGEGWNAVLDKYHRRKVHEVRVRCRFQDSGCEWVGEVNEFRKHAESCTKRPWECKYCAVKCTFGEGEGKHLATCPKVPDPCPNGCEVGSVERCNMEQHLSVCPLEPVACEMKEFGCSVVVPRKELPTHMKESELQHLTVMTMSSLSLTRQLQQESKERDAKIAQLQNNFTKRMTQLQKESKARDVQMTRLLKESQERDAQIDQLLKQTEQRDLQVVQLQEELTEWMQKESTERMAQLQKESTERMAQLQKESKGMDWKITSVQKEMYEQKKMQTEILCKITQLQSDLGAIKIEVGKQSDDRQLGAVATSPRSSWERAWQHETTSPQPTQSAASPIGQSETSGSLSVTITEYMQHKEDEDQVFSEPFYTHVRGYKFKLQIIFYEKDIGAGLYLMKGEYDRQLEWPVEVNVRLELHNQTSNSGHVVRTENLTWEKTKKEKAFDISDCIVKYSTLEKNSLHMLNDCLKFKVAVDVL